MLTQCPRDCLTSVNWSGACSQVSYAIKQHTIDKVVILGSASIFSHTGEYIFWQHEMGFVLAIFKLGEFNRLGIRLSNNQDTDER